MELEFRRWQTVASHKELERTIPSHQRGWPGVSGVCRRLVADCRLAQNGFDDSVRKVMITFIKQKRITLLFLSSFVLVGLFAFARRIPSGPTFPSNSVTRAEQSALLPPNKASATTSVSLDSDNDGIPDSAELRTFTDRDNFRRWFTAIAEMQFYRLSNDWNREQRDCAGLVRFAWREALRRHDRPWFQKAGPGYEAVGPDVAGYNLETSPLGEKLFRTDFGSYKQSDLSDGRFSEFADARTLKTFNCVFITRDRRQAQKGDLLFFYQPWVQKFPFHVMVFLGEPGIAPNGANDWVVYHTGSSPTDDGTVKKLELSVLDHHPDQRWRPIEGNRNFLGFYRLKILE